MKKAINKFTKKQKEEILDAIDLRLDTISDDVESATAFESEQSLNNLKSKIEGGNMNFTSDEIEWIKEEMKWKLEMHYAAAQTEVGFAAQGNINSLQNSIDKL